MPCVFIDLTKSERTSTEEWYGYRVPSGSDTLVGHSVKPQPCFAVSTASLIPSSCIADAQSSQSRSDGAKALGLDTLAHVS
jgi:hypothetical protein